jgi:hypothetical protein
MDNTGFEKYSGRLNITADIKPWLTLGAYVNGYVSNMDPAAKYTDSQVKDLDKFLAYCSKSFKSSR